MILVDSNVLLDVLTDDPAWRPWSQAALADALLSDAVFINQLIYAELSVAYRDIRQLDGILHRLKILRADLPWEAAYLAGQAFLKYRKKGGVRSSPLPNFYIGAHALHDGMTLVTRDASRYRTYFPKLKLVAPKQRR